MISVSILEDNDRIEPGDYVRQLDLFYEGQSDYLMTTATYGGGPINRLGWIEARYFCPAWVGRTVGEFCKAMKTLGHEFVRGEVPKKHKEKLTASQLRIAKIFEED